MKTIYQFVTKAFLLKYFLIGITTAFLIHSLGSCSKDSSNPVETPPDNNNNVNIETINEGAVAVEGALLTGEAQKVVDLLTDDAKAVYGEALNKINKNELIKLGESLKTRQLSVYSDMYAEYTYIKGGIEYTIAFARKDENTWKLMRL